jgi:hypothetical protein
LPVLGCLMFGVDPDIGSSALRLWVAAGSAALLVFICALAFDWTRTRTMARVGVVVLGAVLGAALAWAFLDAARFHDRNAELRALQARAAALNAESLAPGSPLACLNGLAGDDVEAACEKALFASPATVASATSYVAARFALLADMVGYTQRGGRGINNLLLPLRRSLELDRFGFVAHALAVADGCSSERCAALALLNNPSQLRANLSGQTLDRYLDRYLPVWAKASEVPVADAGAASGSEPGPSPPHKMVNIDFPSAASIPAISIMNPEPPGSPAAAAIASATAGEAKTHEPAPHEASPHQAPARRGRKPQSPPAQAAAAPPAATAVDPVWLPPSASSQASGVAPPAGSAAPPGPVQLNPFPAPPQTSAGSAHTQ